MSTQNTTSVAQASKGGDLAEVYRLVSGAAVAAAELVQLETSSAVKVDGYQAVRRGGGLEWIPLPAAARAHRAETIGGFCQVVERLAPAYGGDAGPVCDVFVGPKSVVAVLDADRRHRVVMDLVGTARWEWLVFAQMGVSLSQRDLVKLLTMLFDGGVLPAGFVSRVRSLKLVRSDQIGGDVRAGYDKMDSSILREVTLGGQELDEIVTFLAVPYLQSPPVTEPAKIRVGIDYDYAKGMFVLKAVVDDIQRARDAALAAIHQEIGSTMGPLPSVRGVYLASE